MSPGRRFRFQRGFTLIELAMVLVVVGLIVSFGLQATQGTDNCYAATSAQMRTIQTAMDHFVNNQRRFPVPAGSSLGTNNPIFGQETPAAQIGTNVETTTPGTEYVGALPFQALGLPSSFAADCWGNKFTYMVTKNLTTTAGMTTATLDASGADTNVGSIKVATGVRQVNPPLVTQKAAYVVISHGADGVGASPRNYTGAIINCNGVYATNLHTDVENCDTTNSEVFASALNTANDPAHPEKFFDDVVIYGEKPCTLDMASIIASVPCPVGTVRCNTGDLCSQTVDGVPGMPVGSCYASTLMDVTIADGPHGYGAVTKCVAGVETPFQVATFWVSHTSAYALKVDKATCSASLDAPAYVYSVAQNATLMAWDAYPAPTKVNTIPQTYTTDGQRYLSTPANLTPFLDGVWQVCRPGCQPQTVNWGGHCSQSLPQTVDTQAFTAYNTAAGYVGTAAVTCNGTTGTYTVGANTCTTETPQTCPATTLTWGAGCTSSVASGADGYSTTAYNTATGYDGSVNVTCSGGAYVKSNEICNTPPPSCPAQTVTWGSGHCSASVPLMVHAKILSVTNTDTSAGYTGNATLNCNAGTLSIVSSTCDTQACTCTWHEPAGGCNDNYCPNGTYTCTGSCPPAADYQIPNGNDKFGGSADQDAVEANGTGNGSGGKEE